MLDQNISKVYQVTVRHAATLKNHVNQVYQGAINHKKTVVVALAVFAAIALAAIVVGSTSVVPLVVPVVVAAAMIGGVSVTLIIHLWKLQNSLNNN